MNIYIIIFNLFVYVIIEDWNINLYFLICIYVEKLVKMNNECYFNNILVFFILFKNMLFIYFLFIVN